MGPKQTVPQQVSRGQTLHRKSDPRHRGRRLKVGFVPASWRVGIIAVASASAIESNANHEHAPRGKVGVRKDNLNLGRRGRCARTANQWQTVKAANGRRHINV